MKTLILLLLLSSDIENEKDWVKGAVVVAVTNSGGCLFKPFVKTGITEDNPDTGEPQILGYEPGNVIISKKGEVIWERVEERVFLPRGQAKVIRGRMCKSPPYSF